MKRDGLLAAMLLAACTTQPKAQVPGVTLQSDCGSRAACASVCGSCPTDCSPSAAAACDAWGDALLRGPEIDLVGAAAAYQRACDADHGVSCAALGLQVQDGRGAPRDVPRAEQLYEKACELGEGIGCFNLGLLIGSAVHSSQDPEGADAWFKRARALYARSCDAGDLQWCLNLGVLHESGFGVPKDAVRSAEIYRAACDKGHGESCTNLALQTDRGQGMPADSDVALALLEETCGDESPLSCGVLAQILMREEPPDGARILSLADQACLQGVAHACAAEAGMYALGEIVAVDFARVSKLERRACDLGVSSACMIEAEVSVQAGDYRTSALFYEKACFIGEPEACGLLAEHLRHGRGVERDLVRAATMMDSSCRMGYPGACVALLQAGQPLPLKEPLLSSFLTTACEGGIDEACAAALGTRAP